LNKAFIKPLQCLVCSSKLQTIYKPLLRSRKCWRLVYRLLMCAFLAVGSIFDLLLQHTLHHKLKS
jgi:hypothetical protein